MTTDFDKAVRRVDELARRGTDQWQELVALAAHLISGVSTHRSRVRNPPGPQGSLSRKP